MIYPKELNETIGILMEVEPLDHMKLKDLGLNNCSHDLFPSPREIPSVDEPEPQLLPNFSPLDVNLGDKRGTDPPINPYSPGSFRMKVVEPLTIHTPPSPHVAYFHRNGIFEEKKKNSSLQTLETVSGLILTASPENHDYVIFDERSLKVLRKFHWMILGGRFNQLSHVSSPLLSKSGEY
ncbi:hypothetical protein Tco_0876181 [Tanacetum coccineum]|uniref:Uncharacterized protein n=1 Tax=Tanacetum coccineum TaxID=301880 RepID=A0ABQ5BRK9_9ASTR